MANCEYVELEQTDDKILDIVVNDILDVVIIKKGNDYQVKVLQVNTKLYNMDTELIYFDEYKKLVGLDED